MFSLVSLPSIPQNTAIILFFVIGDITFKVFYWATAGSREAMPLTFVGIFMTYGRRVGLQMLRLGRDVVDIARTVMDFAAEVGHALYAIVGDAGSTGQSDVELGDRVDAAYSSAEEVSIDFFHLSIHPADRHIKHRNIGSRESNVEFRTHRGNVPDFH